MKSAMTGERLAYSPGEAHRLLGVNEQWLDNRLNDGSIRSIKCEGRRIVPRSAILAFLSDIVA